MSERVLLTDVTCRDGLQDEHVFVPTGRKAAIVEGLIEAGITNIEVTSFVNPKWVPQLADAEALLPRLPHGPRYVALIMNQRGFDRGVDAFTSAGFTPEDYELTFVMSASPRHNKANNNRTIDESLDLFREIATAARQKGIRLRGGMACTFTSPWRDEPIEDETVLRIARTFVEGGCKTLNLADTIGTATPEIVSERLATVRASIDAEFSIHLHDRSGSAFPNLDAALAQGMRRFEGALGGIGGCPFAPGAGGNLNLEQAAAFFESRGYETNVDAAALAAAREGLERELAAALPIEMPAKT